jgi:Tol biopolymer transport system component
VFTATAHFSDGSAADITSAATWSSSNTSVATISNPGGVATPIGLGNSTIQASSAGTTGSTLLTVTPPPVPGTLQEVSAPAPGVAGSPGTSSEPFVSATGRYVVFISDSKVLIPADTSTGAQVFVRDTCIGALTACTPSIERVSENANGDPETSTGHILQVVNPFITPDGRFAAFASNASNLVASPAFDGSYTQIYLVDRDLGTITMVSVNNQGLPAGPQGSDSGCGNGITSCGSQYPSVSADGRFVAFQTYADNLGEPNVGAGGANLVSNIFVRDTCFGVPSSTVCVPRTLHVSRALSNQPVTRSTGIYPAMSGDGRWVVFHSVFASSFLFQGGSSNADVLACDLEWDPASTTPCMDHMRVISDGLSGLANQSASNNVVPAVSADGRFVTFASLATNLAATPVPPNVLQVYVRDRDNLDTGQFDLPNSTGTVNTVTTVASVTNAGVPGTTASPVASSATTSLSLSADGRLVAFATKDPALTGTTSTLPYNQLAAHVIVRDTCARQTCGTPSTIRVSQGTNGVEANADSGVGFNGHPALSGDGRTIAFPSLATNLDPPPAAVGYQNIYLSQTAVGMPAAGAPSVDSVIPTSIQHASPEFTLIVTGAGFTPDTIVQWNDGSGPSDRTTLYLGPRKLAVRIRATDVAAPAVASVRACTAGTCRAASLAFTIN